MISRKMNPLVLLAGALVLPAGAMATSPEADALQVRTENVRYNPADAASEAGAAKLYSKLLRAARNVCGENSGEKLTPSASVALSRCVKEAVETAVASVNIPALTARHTQGRKGSGTGSAVASR